MIDVCLLNARSIRNKTLIIKDFVIDNDINILTLTETWLNLNSNDQTIINSICPTGYLFQHVPREKRGGGVGILFKQSLKLKAGLTKSETEVIRSGGLYNELFNICYKNVSNI